MEGRDGHRASSPSAWPQTRTNNPGGEATAVASDKPALYHQVVTTWLCSVSGNAKVLASGPHGLPSWWSHLIRSRMSLRPVPPHGSQQAGRFTRIQAQAAGKGCSRTHMLPGRGRPPAHSSSLSWEARCVQSLWGLLCSFLMCMAGKSFTLSGPQFPPPLNGHNATCYGLNCVLQKEYVSPNPQKFRK